LSSFTTPADLRMLENYRWQLLAEFDYYMGEQTMQRFTAAFQGHQVAIRIPAGTITDLASTPRLLWAIFPPHGQYAKAAIVHDYMYDQAIGSKAFADAVFLEAMEVLGVPRWRRVPMYWAVRLFGRGNYKRKVGNARKRPL